jgi:hypothetical protein
MDGTGTSVDLTERLLAQFLEMPALRLTPKQTARLLGIDRRMSESVVRQLVEAAFLRRMSDGSLVRADR